MATTKVNEMRKKMFRQFEEQLKVRKPEDSCFYCHSSEDRIVLSHALFWVMTQNIRGRMAKQKFLLLLRQYQEEMLEAYLIESPDFSDLLHYCNHVRLPAQYSLRLKRISWRQRRPKARCNIRCRLRLWWRHAGRP